jgi:hypothetical protein
LLCVAEHRAEQGTDPEEHKQIDAELAGLSQGLADSARVKDD